MAVVTSQVIEDLNLTSMRDMLQAAPFVDIQTERGPGVYMSNTRGTEEMTIQFDTIPGPDPILDRAALPFDTTFIDCAEIVYGAQGLLGGAGLEGACVVSKSGSQALWIISLLRYLDSS